ncbi:VPLPA-CTERM sorting domain-containing protein [Rhodobacteraceae bacterium KMM 6894]|nr:VPLPA-CTERM sorting domain-containing protein [Rhodobacteraceae bacterium KMM 6894]
MNKFVLGTALAAGTIAGATTASAATLDYTLGGYSSVSVSANAPATGPSFTGTAAAFHMTDATDALGLGNNFVAFCLDIVGTIQNNVEYVVNNVNPFQPGRELSALQRSNVENLFNASYGMVDADNNVDAAGFQLALWEAAYETDSGSLSLTSGTRVGSAANVFVQAKANSFLASMGTWDGSSKYKVNFLDADVSARQDLVMAAAVPIPAAGLMLLLGLGGIASLRRRKKS